MMTKIYWHETDDTCFHERILHHQSRALDRGFNLWPLVIRVSMILVTSGGTYRVGSHHSFPEESVRIKRDDKKAKRCCLRILLRWNSDNSALEGILWTWATFIKLFIFLQYLFYLFFFYANKISFGLLTTVWNFSFSVLIVIYCYCCLKLFISTNRNLINVALYVLLWLKQTCWPIERFMQKTVQNATKQEDITDLTVSIHRNFSIMFCT